MLKKLKESWIENLSNYFNMLLKCHSKEICFNLNLKQLNGFSTFIIFCIVRKLDGSAQLEIKNHVYIFCVLRKCWSYQKLCNHPLMVGTCCGQNSSRKSTGNPLNIATFNLFMQVLQFYHSYISYKWYQFPLKKN